MLQQPTAPVHPPTQLPISMERHIQQTNERLQVICQQLKTPQGFMSAARELLEWCSDIRAFQPQYEMGLMVCLQAVSRFAASPGFDLNLGYRLLAVCSSHKNKFSPDHAGMLGQWCEELGKLMLLRHQNRARNTVGLDMGRGPSQSAAMDIARAAALYAANQQMQQRPAPYLGENSQWMPSDQFSVVTTVHAGGMNPPPPTTPTDSNMPAQYMSSMNPNISYTTSPHTHGSAQWAPPNANLFQQTSTLPPPNHVAVPQGTPSSYPPQPSQMYGQMSGGPSAAGQSGPARSQGSNLTAAAAAAAAVVAAATATAHATATLTLKPGEVRMQPHGYDNIHPPPLHPPPSQSQPTPSGSQQAIPLTVGSQSHTTLSTITTTTAPISATSTPSSSSSSSTSSSSSSLMTPIQAPPASTPPNNLLPNSQVQPPTLPQHPVQQLATSQTTSQPPSQPHPANSAPASSVSSHPPPSLRPSTPLSSSPNLRSTPVSSHAAAPLQPHSTDIPPSTSASSSSSSSSSSASLTTGPMATRSATPQFCSPPGDQGSQVTIQPNPAAGVRRTNSPATPGHQNAMMPQQHYPGHQQAMQSQRYVPPQYQHFHPQIQSWAPQGSAMSPGHRVQYVASPPPAGSPLAPQQVYVRPHTYPQQGASMPNSVQPGVPTNAGVPGHYPMPYGNQRPRNLPLESHEMVGSPVDPYGSPVSTPQAPGYRRPPRYPYHPQSSPVPSPHAPFIKMYARTPTGYPVQSPVQPGPPTPTMQPVGPPPYGAGPPGTPTDSGYYGSMQNMHQPTGAVPSPLSRGHVQYMSPDPTPHGVPSFPMQSPPPPGYPNPQYVMGSPANSGPVGPRPGAPPGAPAMAVQNDKLLRLTFPVREGVMLKPFQLEHGKVVSHQPFHLKESVYKMLLHRNDLELQFKCYHQADRLMLCQWPQGVSVSLDGRQLPIDRGDSKTSHKPLYLKHYCQPETNTLEITVSTCCCSHYFVLQLVHRPSVTSVLTGLLRKRLLPTEHCIAKIKRWFASNSDDSVQQTGVRVSLKCPVTFKRINLPARGAECKHIQCFDLEAYLKMNCERGTWKCPVCSSNAQLEGLEVDHYIWGIISEVNQRSLDVDEVMVDATADWKAMEKPPDIKDEEVDTPPPKKPKVESMTSPANSAPDSHPTTATASCYNSNGISNPHKDLNTTPSATLSTPSASSSTSSLAPNSQVPSHIQNSNHIAPQVSNSSANIGSGSRSSSSSVVNQHASHFNVGGHLAAAVTNSTGQQPPTHGQQHTNDNLFDGLEDTDDLNLLHYLNDELPSHELLSSILDP